MWPQAPREASMGQGALAQLPGVGGCCISAWEEVSGSHLQSCHRASEHPCQETTHLKA